MTHAKRKKIGIFGGTFDPVHIGHLRLALELKQQLGLDEMRLIPSHKPPHRDEPQANSLQRAEMLQLALRDCIGLQMDEREIWRDRPSYTYETLLELRAELGADVSVVLCMGADAFSGVHTWFCWQELIHLAHIVVVARPGWNLPEFGPMVELLHKHQREQNSLDYEPAGSIVLMSPRLLPISATEIRQQIHHKKSAQFLVTDAVWQYIQTNHLYE